MSCWFGQPFAGCASLAALAKKGAFGANLTQAFRLCRWQQFYYLMPFLSSIHHIRYHRSMRCVRAVQPLPGGRVRHWLRAACVRTGDSLRRPPLFVAASLQFYLRRYFQTAVPHVFPVLFAHFWTGGHAPRHAHHELAGCLDARGMPSPAGPTILPPSTRWANCWTLNTSGGLLRGPAARGSYQRHFAYRQADSVVYGSPLSKPPAYRAGIVISAAPAHFTVAW